MCVTENENTGNRQTESPLDMIRFKEEIPVAVHIGPPKANAALVNGGGVHSILTNAFFYRDHVGVYYCTYLL